jgi:hypothetical protein
MKKIHLLFSVLFVVFILSIAIVGCKKDETTQLALTTLTAGTIDLNAATAPSNVPVNPTFTVIFSTEVDAASATSANITLVQDYDKANVALTITVAGTTVTITPTAKLGNGALYKLSLGAGLKATNGTLITAIDRSFTTTGTFVPPGQFAYWNFEGNANDQVGTFNPSATGIVAITYVDSRKTAAGKAASFDGVTSLIEIPNGDQLMNTNDFTLSFWVKTNSANKTTGHFVMGLGGWNGFQFEIMGAYDGCKLAAQYKFADGTSGSEDLWFNGAATATTKDNGGWQGWTFCKDLTGSGGLAAVIKDKWALITCTYNSVTKVGTMYINGEKMKSQDFNLWPALDKKLGVTGLKYNGTATGNILAFGFIQGRADKSITDDWADPTKPDMNHFKGLLDDVRIFKKALTANEILLMYNSEKP